MPDPAKVPCANTFHQNPTDLVVATRAGHHYAGKALIMIEVENLSKRYGTKLAVDGLNFVVQPGMVTGFLGPNGAGKSTTMRMIAGLDQPTGGGERR